MKLNINISKYTPAISDYAEHKEDIQMYNNM